MDSIPGDYFDKDDPYVSTYDCTDEEKATLRLEFRDDGLQGFVNLSPLEKVSWEIDSRGNIQVGRYCERWGARDQSAVSYRVTNLRVILLASHQENEIW
jgi:hypothetical protein